MSKFTIDNWHELLKYAINHNASDIHITAGQRPFLRIEGNLCPVDLPAPDLDELSTIIRKLTSEKQQQHLKLENELDFAWNFNGQRFRFNLSQQQGLPSIAIRLIPSEIPSLEKLGCPKVFRNLLQLTSGLILITGRTGSGKTTTLASFLATVSKTKPRHIITLEDPIEYILPADTSFISQREYLSDFFSFEKALKNAMRQDPDIIMIGEMRDSETIRTALDAAMTGHLVLASLHTKNAAETIMRVESFFPAEVQNQIRTQLSIVLQAAISQQLIPAKNGSRVAAFEVLTGTPAVKNLIRTGKIQQLNSAILAGKHDYMQTMEHSLEGLCQSGQISQEIAKQQVEQ